ncbi:hypothetical protein LHP98_10280 [Rhodobacter sp. Har01]|uniref:hypothetical protein n=1 Tax=Rhodobacter sp. Har01 TaxID=2883999 RepID=UPI001D0762EE|nr:hypothetical protein [Rhodobacter sp. Har01]MCB6178518.1 hypothetical protein [Rhodobacter sp. Har01]
MTRTTLALSLGFGGVILATQMVQAQAQCGPREAMVAQLAERYGETQQALGLASAAVMELFASAETGTWTLTLTSPDGTMCLMAAGQAFQASDAPKSAKGDPV